VGVAKYNDVHSEILRNSGTYQKYLLQLV